MFVRNLNQVNPLSTLIHYAFTEKIKLYDEKPLRICKSENFNFSKPKQKLIISESIF